MSSSSMSPVLERPQAQNARSKGPLNSVEWPFEQFPPPPLDGNWIPKFAPPPPSRFPPIRSYAPSDLNLDPPIMPLTYPPPPLLSEQDPTWLDQMLADVMRQRSHLEMCLSEAQTDVANTYAEAGLADAELEEERTMMQAFLNVVASVAGSGFVRRMLQDVDHSIEVMSKPQVDSGSDSGESAPSSSSGPARSGHEPAV